MAKPIHRLDVTGAFCPLPILLAAREMRKLATGDLLEVLGDDPGIREDMPVWCERAGHRLLEMTEEEGRRVRSLVEKGEPRAAAPEEPPERPYREGSSPPSQGGRRLPRGTGSPSPGSRRPPREAVLPRQARAAQ